MPRVFITTLPSEETLTNDLMDVLAGYGMPTGLLVDSGPRAEQQFEQADALILVIGPAWFTMMNETQYQPLRRTLNLALSQSDMLLHLALAGGATIPSMSQIPEDLRPLAYLSGSPLTPENLARDVREIGVKVNQHLKRVDAVGRQRNGDNPAQARRGLPWNILILISALVVGLALVVLPDLLGVDTHRGTPNLPAPRSAAADSAIITGGDSLHLGVSAAISGQMTQRGQSMVNGVTLALGQRPSVTIDGQTFQVDVLMQDSSCSSDGGLLTAQLFTADPGVVGVVGPICNTACFAARGIYETADYASISPGCDAPDLTADDGRSFNRTISSMAQDAALAAQFVFNELGMKQIAVINDETPQTIALADAFHSAFLEAGGRVVLRMTLNSGDINQAEIQSQIEAEAPELVVYAGHPDEAVQIARLIGDVPLLLAANVDSEAFITEMGDEADGVLAYARVPLSGDPYEALKAQYTATFESEPEGEVFAYTYDATQMLLDGVEAVGRIDVIGNLIIDRVALQNFIRSYQGEGISGPLDCQNNGDCATGRITFFRVRQGQLVPLDE